MSWNFRLLAHEDDDKPYLQIHEVHYTKDKVPAGCTQNGIKTGGNSIEEVKMQLNRMKEALDKPILSFNNFPEEFKQDKEL